MCGLIGFVSNVGDSSALMPALEQGMQCARHRGPDAVGTWNNDDVAFGFNRLSIIDLEHSTQPIIWGPEGEPDRYVLVFNGEIYNYLELRDELKALGATFTTEGDGESIVVGYHYWGKAVTEKLRGMFGFLIWDTKTKSIFGARDQFGIKPLYYTMLKEGVMFSSEAKGLHFASGTPTIDQTALQHYLILQYVPEPYTIDKNLRKIESGSRFTYQPGGKLKIERYFHPTFTPKKVEGEAAAQGLYLEIADALRDSVAKHMRADVTVGSFLSGGIDSTAIAALARENNPNLITFTASFDHEGYSEADVAAETARELGVQHVIKTISEQEFTDALPAIIWYLDDPVADPALIPLYFVAQEARKHVKVVLSGEGADELFGGYTIYDEPQGLRHINALPKPLRRVLGRAGRVIPDGVRGKDYIARGTLDLEERYYGNARVIREAQLPGIMTRYNPNVSVRDVTAPWYEISKGWAASDRMQHVDLFTWLRGDILVKADKMTMANSVELRVPFLDMEVLKIARTIPLDQKLTHNTTKFALRRAIESFVPAHVINRKKLGFPVPIRKFLAGDSYEWARNILANSGTAEFINPQAALALLDAHKAGTADNSRQVWEILVFNLWYQIFVSKSLVPQIEHKEYPVKL
ncbi:asparagine synthase (glutamine-hydrolyzing) [Micrococcales bacterium 31B]|nr:asparagine synthase (glutamine-hydrolyzing) [Micrococcales bacterium 31B]